MEKDVDTAVLVDEVDLTKHVVVLPKVTLTITDSEDFNTVLSKGQGVFGYRSLQSHWEKLQYHVKLAQRFYSSCENKVARLNGDRTPLQRTGDKKRSLRSTAQQFYESLSTPMLRKQCALFNIDYENYEDQETIIAALVEKHIEMSL